MSTRSILPPIPLPEDGSYLAGVDIVEIEQVAAAVDSFGDRYLHRVYTEHELASCRSGSRAVAAAGLAARFAAKEAVLKVLRPAGSRPDWRSIEIFRTESGACEVHLSGSAATLAAEAGIDHISVSVSHEAGMAGAVAIATCNRRSRKRRSNGR